MFDFFERGTIARWSASVSLVGSIWAGGALVAQPVEAAPSAVRIEAGSTNRYTDPAGNVWAADSGFLDGSILDRGNIRIANTNLDRLYQTERWGLTGYQLPLSNGSYRINLHFAETFAGVTAAGGRVMTIDVEGTRIQDLDVFKEAGGRNRALVKTVDATVADGRMDIAFQSRGNSAMVNGIEIIPVATAPTPTPKATSVPPTPTTGTTTATAVPETPTPAPATATSVTATSTTVPPFALRVEAGGMGAYTDPSGYVWGADDGFLDGNALDRGNIAIAGTDRDRLYQTERWGVTGYRLPLANGTYTVNLHFAETFTGVTEAGGRVMTVDVEGTRIQELDVFKETGGRDRALVKTVTASVADGQLDIAFQSTGNSAMINAIEVLRGEPSAGRPAATATSVPATPTKTPATATVVPPTATAVPPTAPAVSPTSTPLPSSGLPNCTDSLQARINAAASGSTLNLPACIYRETVTVNKALTINGSAGTQIRGSDRWTSWSGSGPFVSAQSVPALATERDPVVCRENNQRCFWPEQVFIDGAPLTQVASNPRPGQFSIDGNRRVVLADSPSGRTVEVTTRPYWMIVTANGVNIQRMTMTHAGTGFQDAALKSEGGVTNWTVSDSDLSHAHSANIRLWGGRLLRSDVHHGGDLGIAGGGFVQGNKIHHNNTEGFDPGWQAGGMKFAYGSGDVIDGNEVFANDGPGLWCDIHCTNVTFSNNKVYDNTYFGIFYEISENGKIFGNTVWGNGSGYPYYGGGAGIFISSSLGTEVYNNTLAGNGGGIHVSSYDRGPEFPHGSNYVHDNTMIMEKEGQLALAFIEGTANNRGANNRYWYPGAETDQARYEYAGGKSSLSSFNATPGEENGLYLTAAEKDAALRAVGVSMAP